MRRLLCLVLAATACGPVESELKADRRTVYDYELALPREYERVPGVVGDDSKVELWRAPGAEISTDFGLYAAPPQCGHGELACSIASEEIAGRPARVARLRYAADGPHRKLPHAAVVHLMVADYPAGLDLTLNVAARCESAAQCEQALAAIRRVRIVEKASG
jgi:hypothetical protein